MRDEASKSWLCPDLRDVRSAFIAEVLAWAVMGAAVALPFVSLAPTEPPEWWGWLAVALLLAGLFGLPIPIFVAANRSRYRALGLAPPLSLVPVVVAGSQYLGVWAVTPHTAFIYAALVALTVGQFTGRRRAEQGQPRTWQRAVADRMWWVRTAVVAGQGVGLLVALGIRFRFADGAAALVPLSVLFILAALLCVWCWLRFFRPFFELCLEPLFRLLYRVKARGPGWRAFPPFGPCLVIANHGFWFDPCILGMILPRPITPIMTAGFYNVWFLKPILKYVFRVIVVPETPLKRETPEVEQAVAALDRGEVVVIFPEGYLRRKEEVPLRRFGQGVWRILNARPETPVVACWVEGGWGSKFSFKGGPPGAKGKPMDFRRKIDVAVSAAETVPTEVLADQMQTRIHLMNRVAGLRQELGIPLLPAFELPHQGESHEEST